MEAVQQLWRRTCRDNGRKICIITMRVLLVCLQFNKLHLLHLHRWCPLKSPVLVELAPLKPSRMVSPAVFEHAAYASQNLWRCAKNARVGLGFAGLP